MPSKWVDFKTLRDQLSFADVLAHYGLDVQGRGDQVKVLCPFHDDHKPSCGVNLKKQVFNCFACGAGGNALDFATRMEGLDPDKTSDLREGALRVAEIFNITDATTKPSRKRNQRNVAESRSARSASAPENASESVAPAPKTMERKTNKQASPEGKMRRSEHIEGKPKPANKPLSFALNLERKHPYIKQRRKEGGFSKQLVKTFGLGFCKRGMMAGRICFPIHNSAGELIAYSGRWAHETLPDDTPRYLLPKGFEKSKVLFNLHRVLAMRKDQPELDTIVIVEGFWSVMRLHEAGIACVSTFGDSVSSEQVEQLVHHGFSKAILIYDGDEGGRRGTEQSLPLLAARLFTRAIHLEDGIKPDTMDQQLVSDLSRYF